MQFENAGKFVEFISHFRTTEKSRKQKPRVVRGFAGVPLILMSKKQCLAEWTGLEPATLGVTGRYSNQLNYHST
jgi:hypothetical protein